MLRAFIINKSLRQITLLVSTCRYACSTTANIAQQIVHKSNSSKPGDSFRYCVGHVKKYDRENYLAALHINDPRMSRVVFALRAFNVELSLVRDSTNNSDRAKVRFHFWSKLIEEIIKKNSEAYPNLDKVDAYYNYSPIARELFEIFRLVDIDSEIEEWLKSLIGARLSSKVLGYKPFNSLEDLELYCSKSNSSFYHLSWSASIQLNNVWHSNYGELKTVKEISEKLGIAHGLSNVIRGIPYNATKNCCYIPKDLLEANQLTSRDFITNKRLDGEKIAPIVEVLALECQRLVDEAYLDLRYIPNYFRRLFLTRVAIQTNLDLLKKCHYNICDPSMGRRNELLPLNLWLSSIYFRAPIL